MLTHSDLINDINACEPPKGGCSWWWLGQQSFVLKIGTTIIYLDPFLTDLPGRNHPPLLHPEEITHADYVVGTHDHADHIDRPTWPQLAKASPACRFIIPRLFMPTLPQELGINTERFLGVDHGECITCEHGITFEGVASAHEFLDPDPTSGLHPYMGVIIGGQGCVVYHAGDTCRYEGLMPTLAAHRPTLSFLPINGRDAERLQRQCIGNMTWQEAADLAGEIQTTWAIPTHFDMFTGNMEDPRHFVAYLRVKYPQIQTMIPTYGTRVDCGRQKT